jgi:predicted metalloprotease with PDZ domain
MRRRAFALALFLCLVIAAAAAEIEYEVSIANARQHLVRVRIHLGPGSAERDLQLPVWNALYQVRDFAQNVRWVKATGASRQPLAVRKIDKTTWRVFDAHAGIDFAYEIFADQPGPFGAQLNQEHAFLNLAQVLMYAVGGRGDSVRLTLRDVPAHWLIATALSPGVPGVFTAANYDALVDAPLEMGNVKQTFVKEGGATYRIVVHGDPADYDMNALAETVRRIASTAVAWMGDRPFNEYAFFFHFARGAAGGGMEHAFSTAIDMDTDRMKDEPSALAGVAAHEFLHLWIVKRIRPQSLEPIDYTRENYTRALWFCEGVTNTVADYILLRGDLVDSSRWLESFARDIRTLEQRPARHTQSVEESSLDTWLDRYPQYRVAERSISYYNKGQILGVLLDLAVREATQGRRSLRHAVQWMNRQYAQKGRFFPDSDGVRQAVEAVSGADFKDFFASYVAGVADLPYDQYLNTVGLRLERRKLKAPDAGFVSSRNFDQPPIVVSVDEGSEAERAGLLAGDAILTINGKPANTEVEIRVAAMRIGDTLRLRVSGRTGQRDLKIKLMAREQEGFAIVPLDHVTASQRARRAAWLAGKDEDREPPAGGARAGVVH